MSRYLCPECGSDSKVAETRPSYNRLRRRRKCDTHGHKFSTVEVPIGSPEQILDLIDFGLDNLLQEDGSFSMEHFQDMKAYMQSSTREILLGVPEDTSTQETTP